MNIEIKEYTTNLERTKDVINTLGLKLKTLEEAGLPLQSGIADYIGMAELNIKAQKEQLKAVENEIKLRKKQLDEQLTNIKTGSAKFLEEMGVDRLEGNIVSSVTLVPESPKTAKKRFKLIVPKKETEEFLVSSGLAVWEDYEADGRPAMIRVNRRKAGTVVIDESESAAK